MTLVSSLRYIPICNGHTVKLVYYGLGTIKKCPDYPVLIFQVSLHNNVSFGTTARCVDYAGFRKCPD